MALLNDLVDTNLKGHPGRYAALAATNGTVIAANTQTIAAAPAAGLSHYIHTLLVNQGNTTASVITFDDGTSTLFKVQVPATVGLQTLTFNRPIPVGNAKALRGTGSAAGSVTVSALGFTAPVVL